jgi:hypothetical protein
MVDAYAIDPLRNTLWFHITPSADGFNPHPAARDDTDALVRWWGWVRVTATAGLGYVVHNSALIIVPRKSVVMGVIYGLNLASSDIQNCLNTVPNQSVALPDLSEVPWANATSVPTFTFFPLSAASVCQWSAFGVNNQYPRPGATPLNRNSGQQVYGFAKWNSIYKNLNPSNYHPGTDFFGFANPTPEGSTGWPASGASIYSVADHGLIVGIGIARYVTKLNPKTGKHEPDPWGFKTSSASWGATYVNTPVEALTYNLVIRYGSLYVMYAHIRELDPNIYVGKRVDAGARLGIIGVAGTPHLHLEVRSFGTDLRSPPRKLLARVPDNPYDIDFNPQASAAGTGNKYGILAIGNNFGGQGYENGQNVSLHDAAQFFRNPVVAYAHDFGNETIGVGSVQVNGFGPNIDSSIITKVASSTLTPSPTPGGTPFDTVWFGPTCGMKYNAGRPTYPIVPSNNLIRGYEWHKAAFAMPDDPNLTGAQPSNYPTITVTVTPSATAAP